MNKQPNPSIDIPSFRRCLGQFPTGVCIVSCIVDGEKLGMTMSSFNSLSLEPPLVLFSIAQSAKGLSLWERAQSYAINILTETQQQLSNRFARAGANKWEGILCCQGSDDAPVLTGTAGVIECIPYAKHDAGDHRLFILEVTSFQAFDERNPLIFCKGRYGSLRPTDSTAALWPLDIHY